MDLRLNISDSLEVLQSIRALSKEGYGCGFKDMLQMIKENVSLSQQNAENKLQERDNLSIVIPITIIYSIIFVTGIVGNVCTCIVIIRNKYMRTVTNYYLFNLSISDLLLLVLGLPHEIYNTWFPTPYIFGETFCRLRLLASEVSSNVSVITITAFTVERYVAICHPIKVPTHAGLSRAIRVMIGVWLVSLVCAIPIALQFGIDYVCIGQLIPAQCTALDPAQAKIIYQVSTFLFFAFPMSVISLLYFFIAVAIRRSTLSRSGSNASTCSSQKTALNATRKLNVTTTRLSSTPQTKARQSVLKMLVAVVVAFFLCWAPFHIQRLLVVYKDTKGSILLDFTIFYLSGVTYYFSATINPILYSIMSLKFRQAFRSTLLRCYNCVVIRSRPVPRRRTQRNSYTFKFQHRSHISIALHCGAMESSSSTANNNSNNNSNNNNNNVNNNNSNNNHHNNTNAAAHSNPLVLCCGDGGSSSISRPLVEMISRDGHQRERPFHEVNHHNGSNSNRNNNVSERML